MSNDTPGWRHSSSLMTLVSGEAIGLAEGFIPRLVRWTEEDKAAKGLRSLRESQAQPQPPIHFSVLEVIQESRATLLLAETGGGKSILARHLTLCLAEKRLDRLTRVVPRNDLGDVRPDGWQGAVPTPILARAEPGLRLGDLLESGSASASQLPRLLILDEVEKLGDGLPAFLDAAATALAADPDLRLLLLGKTQALNVQPTPAWLARHDLLPLLLAQRRQFEREILAPRGIALTAAAASEAAAYPALFALALRTDKPVATTERVVDAWLQAASAEEREERCRTEFVRNQLEAASLTAGSVSGMVARFVADPQRSGALFGSILRRLSGDPARLQLVLESLTALPGDAGLRAALLAAGVLAHVPQQRQSILASLCRLVEEGRLTHPERAEAGRILAVEGDPRDLLSLAAIPGGTFFMGSGTHPNSAPAHQVEVVDFRMGVYPVTNALYRAFAEATGRRWLSPGGRLPERSNMPATDVTWHDARAFCAWLTERWREEGRIGPGEIVRLPTEPEWERAARGDMTAHEEMIIHPWGIGWDVERANAEDAGFNDTVAVGLFPAGRSPYGCHDMAGQVWEWCSTLWGEDMALPSFTYPYREDGREDVSAPDRVRRVLRGGCFSSVPLKASATYRGSLEAQGYWRGNGFRIAVAMAL